MQTPIKKQTTATAISIKHSLENSAKVISRDIRALLGGCEHVASNYDDSAGLKLYASLQEAVWKLPVVLTPGTLQQKTAYTTSTAIAPPRDWPYKDLHPGVSQYGAFFSLFPLWVAD